MTRRRRLVVLWGAGVVVMAGGIVAVAGFVAARRAPAPLPPGAPVEGLTDVLARTRPGEAPPIAFVDVAEKSGLRFHHSGGARSSLIPEDIAPGVAWGDYDGDGDEDLYVTGQPGPLPASEEEFRRGGSGCGVASGGALFRNDGDGTFTDVTAEAGVPGRGWGMGATWADYDGDGDLDLFLTGFGCSTLYRNDGGVFTDVTARARLEDPGFAAGAAWGDVDADGDLDLYVAHYVEFSWKKGDAARTTMQYGEAVPFTLNPSAFPPEANRLYLNQGNGKFRESAAALGVADPKGKGLQPIFSDLDLDGRPDIYVANDVSANALFRNTAGKFVDASSSSWSADYRGAMGLAVADEDGDGDFDLFITHWMAQENALYRNLTLEFRAKGQGDPFHFTDVADMAGLGAIALNVVGWGTAFLDADNDGRLDLIAVNGHTLEAPAAAGGGRTLAAQKPFLFWHAEGDRGYFEIGARAGEYFRREAVLRGLGVADYDGDGDLDAAVAANRGPLALLRNDTPRGGRWLQVRLKGNAPNTFAVGAKVAVECGGVRRVTEISAGGSYLSMSSLVASFGLGECPSVDSVIVAWPSGATSETHGVHVDSVVSIAEPEAR